MVPLSSCQGTSSFVHHWQLPEQEIANGRRDGRGEVEKEGGGVERERERERERGREKMRGKRGERG